MAKKILLSGSTSYLGSKFMELYGDTYDVIGFARHDQHNPVDMLGMDKLETLVDNSKPDAIIHLAAVVDQDASAVMEPNIRGTSNLLSLTRQLQVPFVYMSSESVYGGREETGDYKEEDNYKPRSVYAQTKVESELLVRNSDLPFLILRGHRFVGVNRHYHKPKQFPDSLKALERSETLHLDSNKLFRPCLLNHICDVFVHYLEHDADEQVILNIGTEKCVTYYEFVSNVAQALGFDQKLVLPDGDEAGWPQNSTLNLGRLLELGYPTLEYKQMLEVIRAEY